MLLPISHSASGHPYYNYANQLIHPLDHNEHVQAILIFPNFFTIHLVIVRFY